MVKNKVGGNKAKKFARKNVNASLQPKKLRFANEEGEMYGIVTKMIGNGQLICLCTDGKERLCFIRNKFSGRNKQSNLVTTGSWLIIGKRDWETPKPGKLEKCDLLEIYDEQEKHRLIQECNINFAALMKEEQKMRNIKDDDCEEQDIIFDANACEEEEPHNESQQHTNNNSKNSNKTHHPAEPPMSIDGIDFDDI